MVFTADMKDLLLLFNQRQVEYVLVGGYAVNYYGYNRSTQDIDIFVRPSPENAQRIVSALEKFGFGSDDVPLDYFLSEGQAIHIGMEPNRIDLLTGLKGKSFADIFDGACITEAEGISFRIISIQHLLCIKRCSTRKKDQADAEELENVLRSKK